MGALNYYFGGSQLVVSLRFVDLTWESVLHATSNVYE